MIDSIRTVKISAKSSVNTASIRRIHGTQWAFQCPANTPENANIGLNNNLAEAVLITDELTFAKRAAIEDLVSSLPEGEILLIVDGNPIRYVSSEAYTILKNARREGSINRGVGIAAHFMWEDVIKGFPVIILRTSHGRPIVPLFVLNEDENRLREIENLLEESLDREIDFAYLLE
jgi:DNA-directed RNA polymerase beta subunit